MDTYISLDSTYVTYRIDRENAIRAQWDTSYNDTIVKHGASAKIFVKELFGKENILFEVTRYEEVLRYVEFKISELKTAINSLGECRW